MRSRHVGLSEQKTANHAYTLQPAVCLHAAHNLLLDRLLTLDYACFSSKELKSKRSSGLDTGSRSSPHDPAPEC